MQNAEANYYLLYGDDSIASMTSWRRSQSAKSAAAAAASC